jgi:hypothetical protein
MVPDLAVTSHPPHQRRRLLTAALAEVGRRELAGFRLGVAGDRLGRGAEVHDAPSQVGGDEPIVSDGDGREHVATCMSSS